MRGFKRVWTKEGLGRPHAFPAPCTRDDVLAPEVSPPEAPGEGPPKARPRPAPRGDRRVTRFGRTRSWRRAAGGGNILRGEAGVRLGRRGSEAAAGLGSGLGSGQGGDASASVTPRTLPARGAPGAAPVVPATGEAQTPPRPRAPVLADTHGRPPPRPWPRPGGLPVTTPGAGRRRDTLEPGHRPGETRSQRRRKFTQGRPVERPTPLLEAPLRVTASASRSLTGPLRDRPPDAWPLPRPGSEGFASRPRSPARPFRESVGATARAGCGLSANVSTRALAFQNFSRLDPPLSRGCEGPAHWNQPSRPRAADESRSVDILPKSVGVGAPTDPLNRSVAGVS